MKNRIESRDFKGEGPTFILGQAPRGEAACRRRRKPRKRKLKRKLRRRSRMRRSLLAASRQAL